MSYRSERVLLHLVGVVRCVRGLRAETDAGNRARDTPGLLIALWLAWLWCDARRSELLHVGERDFIERADADAIAVLSIVIDLDLRAGGQRRRPRRVVDHLRDLRQIHFVRIANVEVRRR